MIETPLTADNNIVFINRDTILRRPREFKTPPPPIYGEEDEYEVDPRESFYDPVFDPHKKKFDFLDSRDGTVSKHYEKYINSKTLRRKQKKKDQKRNLDSLEDSEIYDTIGDLPGYDNQQNTQPRIINRNLGERGIISAGFSRAMSYSPSSTAKIKKNN